MRFYQHLVNLHLQNLLHPCYPEEARKDAKWRPCLCEEEVVDRRFVFYSLHFAAIHAIRDIKSFEK